MLLKFHVIVNQNMECNNESQVKELLELHEEILIKILKYVPRRNDCHLVSHRFNFLCNLVQGFCLNLKPEPQVCLLNFFSYTIAF